MKNNQFGIRNLLVLMAVAAFAIDSQLAAIAAEWNSGNTYQQRVDNLRNGSGTVGGGLNGSLFLTFATVSNDSATDELNGQGGTDYFWSELPEAIDVTILEFVDS